MRHVEELVLNTLIVCPETLAAYGMILTSEDFTGERRDLYAAIRQRCYTQRPVDYQLLAADLAEVDGCSDALDSIAQSATAAHTLDGYIEELKADACRRRAEQIGLELMETGDVAAARKAMDSLHTGRRGFSGAMEANKLLVEELERKAASGDSGLSTGLSDLDRLMLLEPADLCVIAARPGMGKTALMLNIARRSGVPVGIFSLEMSTAQLMTRLVAMAGIDYGRLKRPNGMQDEDWKLFSQATRGVSEQGFWINDTGGLSIDALESDAFRMVREHGVKLLCVDYLQLVTCKAERRLEEVSEVSRRLKAIAKNLGVPVIALSQLNRRTDTGGKPRPQMADLRETGQIEQDADQIVFIYRPEVYVEGEKPGQAQLIVAKNRAGELGSAWTAWQGNFQRFVDLARDSYPRAA